MEKVRVLVCKDAQDAQVQCEALRMDGYDVAAPIAAARVDWDPTRVGKEATFLRNRFVVIARKPAAPPTP
ncbi:MAG TPA: hypothetical protein PK313_06555 [Myxococcota bacterium]|jgi:hypothetical protein|nr:hypothetical protein [Myxococcota bacterium]